MDDTFWRRALHVQRADADSRTREPARGVARAAPRLPARRAAALHDARSRWVAHGARDVAARGRAGSAANRIRGWSNSATAISRTAPAAPSCTCPTARRSSRISPPPAGRTTFDAMRAESRQGVPRRPRLLRRVPLLGRAETLTAPDPPRDLLRPPERVASALHVRPFHRPLLACLDRRGILSRGVPARHGLAAASGRPAFSAVNYAAVVAGYLLQLVGLGLRGRAVGGCPLGNTFEIFQFTAWSAITLYLVVGVTFRKSLLGYFTSCLAAALTLVSLAIPAWDATRRTHIFGGNPWIELHAALALFSYGVFALLALTSLMFLLRNYSLKTKHLGGWFSFLPSILDLDHIGVRLLLATISSKELNGIAPAQTFDAALEGKISGAYINANSGAPGGGISVKLRGVTSVYGNTQPLYVVDGVFVDNTSTSAGLNVVTAALANGATTSNQDNPSNRIADLRPEDIENIEILKGASAAAIYGSKAAAGVVIITTKRGKQGKTNISLSQDLGFIKPRKLLGVRTFTADRAASLSRDSATSAALRQQFLDAQAKGEIYDYEKEIYDNTAFLRNTVLSMNGGNEKTGFYFSVAQKDEGGIVKRTGYNNTSVRLNVDHRITDNIKIGISTNYINSSADRGLFGNDNAGVTTGIALSSTPGFAQLHADAAGNYPNNPFAAANPLQTIALMRNNESVNRFITGANLDIVLQKSNRSTTKFIGRGGFDFYNLQTSVLFPVYFSSRQ